MDVVCKNHYSVFKMGWILKHVEQALYIEQEPQNIVMVADDDDENVPFGNSESDPVPVDEHE